MGPRVAKTWDEIVEEFKEDSNNRGQDDDRTMGWTSWHDETGFPEWLTIWAFVALFICIAAVSCICYTESCNLSLRSLGKYLIAFCMGLLCAMPCLWAPACLIDNYCWRKKLTRAPLFRRPGQ